MPVITVTAPTYSNSKAQAGISAIFAILSTDGGLYESPTWTAIGEITSATQTGLVNKFVPTTNLQSSSEESLPVLPSGGTFDLTLNRQPTDPGQIALLASFTSRELCSFVVQLPINEAIGQTTRGDLYCGDAAGGTKGFTGYVEELENVSDLSAEKVITTKCKIKVSGVLPVLYAGA